MADLKEGSNKSNQHKDSNPSEVAQSEEKVKACIEAFKNFLNPFQIEDKSGLYNLSSGVRVSVEVEQDLLQAEHLGEIEKNVFINDRLKMKDHFFNPIKKLKLKTMANTTKVAKVNSSKNKVIELKQQGNIAFQLLVKSQSMSSPMNLDELMTYQLTPIPYCLGTPDGYLNKTNKAVGLKMIALDKDDTEQPNMEETLLIIDGNALFYCMTEVPDTIKGACEKVFSMIPGYSDVIFSTDMYRKNSVKSLERKRRGCGEKLLLKGPSMKRPADWKSFLSNDDNKQQFTDILMRVWTDDSFSDKLKDRKVI